MKHFFRISRIHLLAALPLTALLTSLFPSPEMVVSVTEKQLRAPDPKATQWAETQLSKMTLREKIAQFFMVAAYPGKPATLNEADNFIKNDHVGGVILFQGTRAESDSSVARFQRESEIPLFIGMDAEWGMEMRLSDVDRFPYAYTLGAANDPELTKRIGEMMAAECREAGIHMNFAPVADVNSNPLNPVIGFRSYGESPKDVAFQVSALVKSFESNGVMSCLKHFPGHGNTSADSHYNLPLIDRSLTQIEAIDWYPFREGISAGASSVMVGHLNVPALDQSGMPSSLSAPVIRHYLQEELGFDGLVISDALNMKAVTGSYGKQETVEKAFMAGCDILLFPESVTEAIDGLVKLVESGKISAAEVDARCRKVLSYKYRFVINPPKYQTYSPDEIKLTMEQVYDKAVCLLKNDDASFPVGRLDEHFALVSIGEHDEDFLEGVERFYSPDVIRATTAQEAQRQLQAAKKTYQRIVTVIHAKSVRAVNSFSAPANFDSYSASLPQGSKNTLVIFGNPRMAGELNTTHYGSVVLAYENHPIVQERVSQMLFGALPVTGKTPFYISSDFKRGSGVESPGNGRLRYASPAEFGISAQKLAEIDAIAWKGISEGAYPGCQIVVAWKGSIIYRKSFGNHRYEGNETVKNDDLYDIASVTKIAASTLSLMKLESEGKFSVELRLKDYIPEITGDGPYGDIKLKEMLTHQAGLKSWIPFYTATLLNGELDTRIYSRVRTDSFSLEVAPSIFMKNSYADSMYTRITGTRLGTHKYLYSDLGYYFIKKIVEKQSGMPFDQYVEGIYREMGLRTAGFNPYRRFDLARIAPTEDDRIFRKQLVHGYVHDPGAAMVGGVGGHAGVFTDATDLAAIMQLFLNGGTYGGIQYIKPEVIARYTSCVYCPGNRRGIGFDKPLPSLHGGPTCGLVSLKSFGHTGFTGTMAWADPEYDINYVFLSNRVYPDAENWKIVKMDIRTDIQRVIYEALRGK